VTVGDGISGLGPTRHKWVPSVRAEVQAVLREYPQLSANTYVCHPWCGWGRWSVDFWDLAGRGVAAPFPILRDARSFLLRREGFPLVRHTILEHVLWTSFGGFSEWPRDDHSGDLRHLHVTFWRT
jgi:hypothetical protein